MGILDKIIDTKHNDLLQNFEPTIVVAKIMEQLKDREKKILSARFGLLGSQVKTLEVIGKEQGLTRERVRQIEKTLIKTLRNSGSGEPGFVQSRDLLLSLVNEHGGIIAEHVIFEHLKFETAEESNSITFILHLMPELKRQETDEHIHKSWVLEGFNLDKLLEIINHAKSVLVEHSKPLNEEHLMEKFKDLMEKATELNHKVISNYLKTAKAIKKNAFGQYGISNWSEIQPKDVGDKAYLVMKHHGKPEHYTVITEIINKHHFDTRKAYKETVHNELIKDKRFILVGRGIYALSEWGYKSGVVADVIKEILEGKPGPMTREEIVNEVLKRRLVKKNTVLVGLSNKKYFKKVGKNLYTLHPN